MTGEYVQNSKNSKNLYICGYAENCKWTQFITVKTAKDCYDYSGWGNNATLMYESVPGRRKYEQYNVFILLFSGYASICNIVFGILREKIISVA